MAGTEGFAPTHRIVTEGADWWAEPRPEVAAQGRLDPALPVEVLEETTGWAHLRASNGWECWIDARFLAIGAEAPVSTAPTTAPQAAAPPAAAAAADAPAVEAAAEPEPKADSAPAGEAEEPEAKPE